MAPDDPKTPEEWQKVVNVMRACLLLDEAIRYRVITVRKDAPIIDVERCRSLIERGVKLGYRVEEIAAQKLAIELLKEIS
jgi:hypothetical protein